MLVGENSMFFQQHQAQQHPSTINRILSSPQVYFIIYLFTCKRGSPCFYYYLLYDRRRVNVTWTQRTLTVLSYICTYLDDFRRSIKPTTTPFGFGIRYVEYEYSGDISPVVATLIYFYLIKKKTTAHT